MSLEIAIEKIEFAKKTKSTILNLSHLGLEKIPNEILELKQLEKLYLSCNQISDPRSLEQLKQLTELDLSNNKIFSSRRLGHLQQLVRLDLSGNKISGLGGLPDFPQLKSLNLSYNQLSKVEALGDFIQLESLNFSNNLIVEIEELTRFKKLQQLFLVGNQLTELPSHLLELNLPIFFKHPTDGIGIFLGDNPFNSPPPEIVEKGNAAIKVYFDSLTDAHRPLNEVKVILIGNGSSGKTSLVRRILDQGFDTNEEQTHGIKISNRVFNIKNQELTINFWDFGGQEIMHATHQFFLTKRCLYLLVLNSRKDEKAEYWLKYIQSFGGDAPVIIVLNKIDEHPAFDVNRKFLTGKYPNIKKFFKVSCKENQGIDDLKASVLEHLWELELCNTPFPSSWFQVKDYFKAMTENYIKYEQYEEVCLRYGIKDTKTQKTLLDFLNDLGIIFNFSQFEIRLLDTQVLNPLWLTNAVYRIINSPKLAGAKGRFRLGDLESIFHEKAKSSYGFSYKDTEIPYEKFLFIIAVMKEFELLFRLSDQEYIVPDLLPLEQNTYIFPPGSSVLHFKIEYPDFLPPSIIPRLMVKMHEYVFQGKIWKTGMVLQDPLLFESTANISLDSENSQLVIEITGKRSRDFLTMIRETIRRINADYEKLDFIEWIPLPEPYKGEEVLVEYEELLGYESSGEQYLFSGKLRKNFSVADLLNGIETPESRKKVAPCHIYISYSEQDEQYRKELSKHLKTLVRLNKATVWDVQSVEAGGDWKKEMKEHLDKAEIVLCLLSNDFISSDFCITALNSALSAHDNGEKTVIPLKVRMCHWQGLPISQLQGLPFDHWVGDVKNDQAWMEVVREVEKVIDQMQKEKYGI